MMIRKIVKVYQKNKNSKRERVSERRHRVDTDIPVSSLLQIHKETLTSCDCKTPFAEV